VKNRKFICILFFLTLIASTVFGSMSENSRQGFEEGFTEPLPASPASLSAFTTGFLAWDMTTNVKLRCFGNFRWPDKPGQGVAPCREDELDSYLDRLEGTQTLENTGFDPFWLGRHHAKVMTPNLYTGRRFDAFTQNYNLRNRYYNPRHGRFLSSDPIGFAGGPNRFGYCRNNPLLYIDPYGLYTRDFNPWAWNGKLPEEFATGYKQGLIPGAIGGGATVLLAGGASLFLSPAAATFGLLGLGAIGIGSTIMSVAFDPSLKNMGYNLGSLTGGAIVGFACSWGVSAKLSPPSDQPAAGAASLSLAREFALRMKYDPTKSLWANFWTPMGKGPTVIGAGSSIAVFGAGLAIPEKSLLLQDIGSMLEYYMNQLVYSSNSSGCK